MKEKKNMVDNEFVSIVPDLSRYMAALVKLLQRFYYVQIGKRLFLGGKLSKRYIYRERSFMTFSMAIWRP